MHKKINQQGKRQSQDTVLKCVFHYMIKWLLDDRVKRQYFFSVYDENIVFSFKIYFEVSLKQK